MKSTPNFGRPNELALWLLLALCVRKMELLSVRWSEFDLEAGVWHLHSSIDDAPLTRQFGWKMTRLPRLAAGFLGLAMRARIKRVATRSIWGTALMNCALGSTIFNDFLGLALASGRFVPAPKPLVAGRPLESLPQALGILRRGVSASKVVVSL